MDFGAAMFFTGYSMTPVELGQELEARGFESVWAPEHSHIPSTRKTPPASGGELEKRYYALNDEAPSRPQNWSRRSIMSQPAGFYLG